MFTLTNAEFPFFGLGIFHYECHIFIENSLISVIILKPRPIKVRAKQTKFILYLNGMSEYD